MNQFRPRFRARSVGSAVAALLLALALAGCTVTFISDDRALDPDRTRILQRFEPAKGAGSSYRVGEEISFRVRASMDGYLTLTSLAPDGEVYTFARNVFVRGRRTVTIDGSSQGVRFVVDPPRGWHRVRASFTPRRTNTGRVTFRGISGEGNWRAAIRLDLEPFDVRDVVETRFYVR